MAHLAFKMSQKSVRLAVACLLSSSGLFSQISIAEVSTPGEEDLEESQGLDELAKPANERDTESPAPKVQDSQQPSPSLLLSPTAASAKSWKIRAYIQLSAHETRFERLKPATKNQGPNGEISLNMTSDWQSPWSLFVDGRASSSTSEDDRKNLTHLNQGGLRFRPQQFNSFVLAVGKERNRRAPGLTISPSDFVHTSQSVPGMAEEREGVWLVRSSLQQEKISVDAIALLSDGQRENGLPESDTRKRGGLVRTFARLPLGLDLGLDIGQVDKKDRAGAFVQGYVAGAWKLYAETGLSRTSDRNASASATANAPSKQTSLDNTTARSSLLGLGYEGFDKISLRTEYYQKNDAWQNTLPVLSDNSVFLASAQIMELQDRFNCNWSILRSLAHDNEAHIARLEWLATPQQVAGMSWIRLIPAHPVQSQMSVDWKYSF
jgi:hypothetical protein